MCQRERFDVQADDRLAVLARTTILTERNRILNELATIHESGEKLTLRRIIQVVEDKQKDMSR